MNNPKQQQENRKMNVPLMPSLPRNQRSVAAVQQPAMPVLHSQADSENWTDQNDYGRRNHCTAACGFVGCSRLRASGAGDSQAGKDQRASAGTSANKTMRGV